MPNSSTNVPVALRLSTYQVGDRENPRYVWSFGLPVEFLNNLPLTNRRVLISASKGIVTLTLSEQGIKFGVPPRGRTGWAGGIGSHHITGLSLPTESARSIPMEGTFYPDDCKIEISRNLPDILQNAIIDATSFEEASDPRIHFPAAHFQEDLEAAANTVPVEPEEQPLAGPTAPDEATDAAQMPVHYDPLPVNIADWTDDNVRRLRELLQDMQSNRPDIVLTLDGDTIRFQRHILTDL